MHRLNQLLPDTQRRMSRRRFHGLLQTLQSVKPERKQPLEMYPNVENIIAQDMANNDSMDYIVLCLF